MSRNNVVGSEPYHKCTDAYTKGHSLEKVISYYNNWAQEGTYETVCMSNIAIQHCVFNNVSYSI